MCGGGSCLEKPRPRDALGAAPDTCEVLSTVALTTVFTMFSAWRHLWANAPWSVDKVAVTATRPCVKAALVTGHGSKRPPPPPSVQRPSPCLAEASGRRGWPLWSQCPAVQAALRMGFRQSQVQRLVQREYRWAVPASVSASQLVADLLREDDEGRAAEARGECPPCPSPFSPLAHAPPAPGLEEPVLAAWALGAWHAAGGEGRELLGSVGSHQSQTLPVAPSGWGLASPGGF